VELRYAITFEEFVEASMLRAKAAERKRQDLLMKSWRGLVFLLFLLASGLVIAQMRGWGFAWVMIFLGVVYALSVFYRKLICPGYLRRSYEEQKSGFELRIAIGEAGIEAERTDGAVVGHYLWTAFVAYLEGQNTFALFLNRMQFIIIPKRSMKLEQQQELRVLLAAHFPEKGFTTWKSQSAVF
jgi:hypothetical protein